MQGARIESVAQIVDHEVAVTWWADEDPDFLLISFGTEIRDARVSIDTFRRKQMEPDGHIEPLLWCWRRPRNCHPQTEMQLRKRILDVIEDSFADAPELQEFRFVHYHEVANQDGTIGNKGCALNVDHEAIPDGCWKFNPEVHQEFQRKT